MVNIHFEVLTSIYVDPPHWIDERFFMMVSRHYFSYNVCNTCIWFWMIFCAALVILFLFLPLKRLAAHTHFKLSDRVFHWKSFKKNNAKLNYITISVRSVRRKWAIMLRVTIFFFTFSLFARLFRLAGINMLYIFVLQLFSFYPLQSFAYIKD